MVNSKKQTSLGYQFFLAHQTKVYESPLAEAVDNWDHNECEISRRDWEAAATQFVNSQKALTPSSKKIIIIGGYARSGKSTTVRILRNTFNIPCYSTSEVLHQVTNNLLTKTFDRPIPTDVNEKRALCISVAEDALVPVFGRQVFAQAVAAKALSDLSPVVAIESVGGEEYMLLLDCLAGQPYQQFNWNLRRTHERAGIDLRKLLPDAIEIWADGSEAKLLTQIGNLLEKV